MLEFYYLQVAFTAFSGSYFTNLKIFPLMEYCEKLINEMGGVLKRKGWGVGSKFFPKTEIGVAHLGLRFVNYLKRSVNMNKFNSWRHTKIYNQMVVC